MVSFPTSNVSTVKRPGWEIDAGKILLKSFVAGGGCGHVHKALYDGKLVGVMFLNWGKDGSAETRRIRESFMNEVDVWHKLDHPNIAKFIGAATVMPRVTSQSYSGNLQFDLPENACSIVAEYHEGGTLKYFLTRRHNSKLDFQTVIRFSIDVAEGLSYLHSKKIAHRNIKPDNILIGANSTLKITGFGIAAEDSDERGLTGFVGSYGYMAPEVFYRRPYTTKCDVYSFGICLWEIFCCDEPYKDVSDEQIKSARVYKDLRPKIPRNCPKSLKKVMKRCWEMDPYKRPTMKEVVSMLKAIDTGRRVAPRNGSPGCFCWNL